MDFAKKSSSFEPDAGLKHREQYIINKMKEWKRRFLKYNNKKKAHINREHLLLYHFSWYLKYFSLGYAIRKNYILFIFYDELKIN